MIAALGLGALLGFVMSIPPGPISIAVIKQGINGDTRAGGLIGLGAAGVDVLYALLAVFASSAIVGALETFFAGHPWYLLFFQIACIAILVILGVRFYRTSTSQVEDSKADEKEKEDKVRTMGAHTGLMIGAGMAVMNLANPTFIPSMITVAGFLHSESLIGTGFLPSVLYGIGFGIGVYFWFLLLLRIVLRMRSKVSDGAIAWIFKVAGGAFVLFAAILAYNVATSTDWAELMA